MGYRHHYQHYLYGLDLSPWNAPDANMATYFAGSDHGDIFLVSSDDNLWLVCHELRQLQRSLRITWSGHRAARMALYSFCHRFAGRGVQRPALSNKYLKRNKEQNFDQQTQRLGTNCGVFSQGKNRMHPGAFQQLGSDDTRPYASRHGGGAPQFFPRQPRRTRARDRAPQEAIGKRRAHDLYSSRPARPKNSHRPAEISHAGRAQSRLARGHYTS